MLEADSQEAVGVDVRKASQFHPVSLARGFYNQRYPMRLTSGNAKLREIGRSCLFSRPTYVCAVSREKRLKHRPKPRD